MRKSRSRAAQELQCLTDEQRVRVRSRLAVARTRAQLRWLDVAQRMAQAGVEVSASTLAVKYQRLSFDAREWTALRAALGLAS